MDSSLLFLLLGKENPWMPWILLVLFLSPKLPEFQAVLSRWIFTSRSEYELTTTLFTEKRLALQSGNITTEMEAFLYFLHKNHGFLSFSKSVNLYLRGVLNHTLFTSVSCPAHSYGIWITPKIYATFYYTEESSTVQSDSRSVGIHELRIRIVLSSWYGLQGIQDFLTECIRVIEEDKEKLSNKLYIIKPGLDEAETRSIPFSSGKTMDSLFFDGKEALLARLDSLRSDCSLIRNLGLSQSLGLLLYGEPGTGKTSTIKAIANYMQMSLILVPMNQIKTRTQLESLFYNKSTCWIDFSKRIYVFEEIDCNGWEHIVCPRFKVTDVKVEEKEKKEKKPEDPLTLGAILEVLDGIVETPGRIVIMTTNRRNELDPALIRPGRIDLQLEFGRLRREHVAQIYEQAFQTTLACSIIAQIPDRKFTQAEVSQLLWTHWQDKQACLQALLHVGE